MVAVELLYNEEVKAEDGTDNEQAILIAERLGLAKQVEVRKTEGRHFSKCTREQELAYKHICPTETKLADYTFDAIPLRVLDVIEQCKPHFDDFVVWHPALAKDKDPILLGVKKTGTKEWERAIFPLARWGEALEDFHILVKKATADLRRKRINELRKAQSDAASVLKVMLEDPNAGTLESLSNTIYFSPSNLLG